MTTTELMGLGLPAALAERLGYTTHAGNPNSSITPKFIGQWVLDITNDIWYRAAGTATTDWKALNA